MRTLYEIIESITDNQGATHEECDDFFSPRSSKRMQKGFVDRRKG